MGNSHEEVHEYVAGLFERARRAQIIAETFGQERVDEIVSEIAFAITREHNVQELGKLAFEESKLGNYESKCAKLRKKPRGVLWQIKEQPSVGVIQTDYEKGIKKIAKPVGVIGAVIPCTNPEITPVIKAMCALKARNAVVFSPHPRTQRTTYAVVQLMRNVLISQGAPEDLLICAENPNHEMSNEIMKQCDLVIATGGAGMVKAAYSSGTPAYGVGAGNAVVIVDETADIDTVCPLIIESKTNDLASGCSSENSVIVHSDNYDKFIETMRRHGAYLCNEDEKNRLQNALWKDCVLNSAMVAQPACKIASQADIAVDDVTRVILVEETGYGPSYPFSREKISVVLTVYKYIDIDDAISLINGIHSYCGGGHSCGIHSSNDEHIMKVALETHTSRVMVRQGQNFGNSGNWNNGMPWTVTLGCGTWGGNIASENITLKHYMNTTWVSYPIESWEPSDEELFGQCKSWNKN